MMGKNWKKIDGMAKRGILGDEDLNKLLQPFFPTEYERANFIKKCLTKLKIRRMLLRVQWYSEMADGMDKVRGARPALGLIFLMGLAEGVAKKRLGKTNTNSLNAIKEFFSKYIPKEDEDILVRNFKRTLLSFKHHRLRFSSILRILYEVRNQAVHGEDFWSFSLLDSEEKRKHSHYTHYGLITSGSLGKRYRKRRVSLDITLTYEELRDIFIRTAINNIKSLF